jgi:centromere protein I
LPKSISVFDADRLQTSVTLEEVNTVTDFVGSLERIEPPSQLVAGLRDPLLQKFMALRSSPDSSLRLEFWLERYFEEEIELLQEGFGLSTSLPEILKGIISYTEASKVCCFSA